MYLYYDDHNNYNNCNNNNNNYADLLYNTMSSTSSTVHRRRRRFFVEESDTIQASSVLSPFPSFLPYSVLSSIHYIQNSPSFGNVCRSADPYADVPPRLEPSSVVSLICGFVCICTLVELWIYLYIPLPIYTNVSYFSITQLLYTICLYVVSLSSASRRNKLVTVIMQYIRCKIIIITGRGSIDVAWRVTNTLPPKQITLSRDP